MIVLKEDSNENALFERSTHDECSICHLDGLCAHQLTINTKYHVKKC